jgi:heavy metal translocating P-type ATPase
MTKITLPVKGMYCAHCSKAVEQALADSGVKASVDLAKSKVLLSYDETKISLPYLKRVVGRAGYDLVIDSKRRFDFSSLLLWVSAVILLLSVFGMIHHLGAPGAFFEFFGNDLSFLILASISLVVLGTPFFIRAVKGLRYFNIGMDFLIAFSSLTAYVLSLYCFIRNLQNGFSPTGMFMGEDGYRMTYFDSTAMILSIITLGHALIDTIKAKSEKAYHHVAFEIPSKATRIGLNGKEETLEVDAIDVGDTLKILSGETVPVDGTILTGTGFVNESSLSGESRERFLSQGSNVFGGTALTAGPLTMKADKIALDSLYTSILNESYVLDQKKGKLNRLSDKIASIFTPLILVIALAAFFIAFYGMRLSAETSVLRAVSVLCVSCPCAFGLAVPLSALSGFDSALKNGVLFKTGDTFEKVKGIKAVIFDKTGTLSSGVMTVVGKAGDDSYLPKVKAMEKNSLHPLAKALLATLDGIPDEKLIDIHEIPGIGLQEGAYLLGGEKTIRGKRLSDALKNLMAAFPTATLVFLSDEKEVLLAFAVEDTLSSSSVETVRELEKRGIPSYLLTGDRKEIATAVAEKLGIPPERVFAEATPQSKAALLRQIREKEGMICYVGDGINDTLALKESDLSFAPFGASEAACSSADALLLTADLSTLIQALLISQKTYANIIENFLWAIAYNVCLIPLAILGYLSPSLSAALMIASNLTLTLNSLRIRFYQPKKEKKHESHRG